MHGHSPIVQPAYFKKIRPITLIVWMLCRVEKNEKIVLKNVKTFIFSNKCNTCFYTPFSRAFLKYSFWNCSFSHKTVMSYFRFFYTEGGCETPPPLKASLKKIHVPIILF